MGIQGLLPLLKSSSRQANIVEFKGCTVAIDSYCWLHRGAFACAEKLALGEATDQYVFYCMKYVNNLLAANIKPIMVFDGCRLPSKKNVEKQRRERREMYRKKAAQFLREGKKTEARDCLSKCVDITPQMALELMNACREKGVDCIVAPYEADAQLAFLSKKGIAQVVITEDSDLVLFGCERIMFKMDVNGNGVLIEKRDLPKAVKLRPDLFTFDKFRYMCIMSGCDYLPSLPGIGLGKACKIFQLTRQTDMKLVLKKIPSMLNMANLDVNSDYIEGFFRADNTFLYQLVYDPLRRKLVPLNPYPPEIDVSQLEYAGPYMDEEYAFQLALGNIDIYTGQQIFNFNPDWHQERPDNSKKAYELSIWNSNYAPMPQDCFDVLQKKNCVGAKCSTTKGKEVTVKLPQPIKRKQNDELRKDTFADVISETEINSLYGGNEVAGNCRLQFYDKDNCKFGLFNKTHSETYDSENSEMTNIQSNKTFFSQYVDSQPGSLNEDSANSQNKGKSSTTEQTFIANSVMSPTDHAENDKDCDDYDCSTLTNSVNNDSEEATFPVLIPKPKRNKFAISSNVTKSKPSFLSNISPPNTREVKSRFFMTEKPLKQTNFFKELSCLKENEKYSNSKVAKEFKPVRPSASVLSELRKTSLIDDKSASKSRIDNLFKKEQKYIPVLPNESVNEHLSLVTVAESDKAIPLFEVDYNVQVLNVTREEATEDVTLKSKRNEANEETLMTCSVNKLSTLEPSTLANNHCNSTKLAYTAMSPDRESSNKNLQLISADAKKPSLRIGLKRTSSGRVQNKDAKNHQSPRRLSSSKNADSLQPSIKNIFSQYQFVRNQK